MREASRTRMGVKKKRALTVMGDLSSSVYVRYAGRIDTRQEPPFVDEKPVSHIANKSEEPYVWAMQRRQ